MCSDSELIARAKRGERVAFDALVQRYHDMVRYIASSFAAIPEDADDLVQEAFVTAYLRLDQLTDPNCFGSWLAVIVRNEGRMWHRRRQVQPKLLSLDGSEEAEQHAVKASVRAARELERRNLIRNAIVDVLSGLNARQRQVIELHYLLGYDYIETASLLNVPIAAVRGRLERARSILKRELNDMVTMPAKEWSLNNRDLNAICTAAKIAPDNDLNHPELNSIFLTGDGQLVSTDACRLFVYSSQSLSDIPTALIHASLGRELPDVQVGGKLTINDEAVIRLQDGSVVRAPLVAETFPNWKMVVPSQFGLKAIARCGDWLKALELLAKEQKAVECEGSSRVLIVMLPVEKQITLRQGHEPVPKEGKLAREVSIWFKAEFSMGDKELILAMNPNYLEQAIRFLGLSEDANVELCANSWNTQVLTQAAGGGDTFTVTMPMQRVESAMTSSQ